MVRPGSAPDRERRLGRTRPRSRLSALLVAGCIWLGAGAHVPCQAQDRPTGKPSPLNQLDPATIPADERQWFSSRELPAEVVAVLRRPNWHPDGVAFSPDGRWLAGGDRSDAPPEVPSRVPPVLLWDTADLREPLRLDGHKRGVWAIAFSADGNSLASASRDTTVRLWDVRGEKPNAGAVLEGHKGWVLSAAFSPDGKTLAAAGGTGDGAVWLWDLGRDPPAVRAKLEGSKRATASVGFSADGKRLAVADNGGDEIGRCAVRLWDLGAGRAEHWAALETHREGEIGAVAFSGKLLAAVGADRSAGPTLRLWDVSGDHPRELTTIKTPPPRGLRAVAFTPDGKRLAAGGDPGPLTVWDVEGKQLYAWREMDNVGGVAFAPDGKHLAVAAKGAVYILRLAR